MTQEERIAKAKEWHDRYVLQAEEKEKQLAELTDRLSAARARLDEIKNNIAYRLLPSWIKEKLEEIFGGIS